MVTRPRRRQAGEGSISEYSTKAGPRYLIKYTFTVRDGEESVKRTKLKRGFSSRAEAAKALRTALAEVEQDGYVEPTEITVAAYMTEWVEGLRKQPSTVASYRRLLRLHVIPHIGTVELRKVTPARLARLYRYLEQEGRADQSGGLSARTVRYLHTVLHSAFGDAVEAGLLVRSPAATKAAKAPTVKEAASPEIRTWSSSELQAFLSWSAQQDDELHIAWLLLAMTGMRRGEALALQWRDIDFDAATIAVRRSVTVVKTKGEGQEILTSLPKSGKPRVIDVDPDTLAALRSWRARVGAGLLALAAPSALVLGTMQGGTRHPEAFSRSFTRRVARAGREIEGLPAIRLHDLRHTHATLLMKAGVNPKVVQERLGHSDVSITLRIYSHTNQTMQRDAAAAVAAMVFRGTA